MLIDSWFHLVTQLYEERSNVQLVKRKVFYEEKNFTLSFICNNLGQNNIVLHIQTFLKWDVENLRGRHGITHK